MSFFSSVLYIKSKSLNLEIYFLFSILYFRSDGSRNAKDATHANAANASSMKCCCRRFLADFQMLGPRSASRNSDELTKQFVCIS